jgi:hypothetical protein
MLQPDKFPHQTWINGQTCTVEHFQKMNDAIENADRRPFNYQFWSNYFRKKVQNLLWKGTDDGSLNGTLSPLTGVSISTNSAIQMFGDEVTTIHRTINDAGYSGAYLFSYPAINICKNANGDIYHHEDACFIYTFFISDVTEILGIYVLFGQDSDNHYRWDVGTLQDGWNIKYIKLADVPFVGTEIALGDTFYWEFKAQFATNASGAYFAIQSLSMFRLDSEGQLPHILQESTGVNVDQNELYTNVIPRNNSNSLYTIAPDSRFPSFNQDYNIIPIRALPEHAVLDLYGRTVTDFYLKMTHGVITAGFISPITWRIGSDDYVTVYIAGHYGAITSKNTYTGEFTNRQSNLLGENSVQVGDVIELQFWKVGTAFHAIIHRLRAGTRYIHSILDSSNLRGNLEGFVFLGSNGQQYCSCVNDWTISVNPAL